MSKILVNSLCGMVVPPQFLSYQLKEYGCVTRVHKFHSASSPVSSNPCWVMGKTAVHFVLKHYHTSCTSENSLYHHTNHGRIQFPFLFSDGEAWIFSHCIHISGWHTPPPPPLKKSGSVLAIHRSNTMIQEQN